MRRVLGSLGFASALVAIVSCEAIVSDTIPQFTCTGGSTRACPANQYCKGSGCTACEKVDVCDHFDNDCNGTIDDGPLSDADNDGFSVCGTLAADGSTSGVDCNDGDPGVHPGSADHPAPPEVCNGIDDNCDGIVDNTDSATLCPSGLTCAPSGQCVNTDCTKTPCAGNDKCDPLSLQCITPASKAMGEVCTQDGECQRGLLCANITELGPDVTKGAGVCTRACCQSSDCGDASLVCFGAGLGGNYCVKGALIGRSATGSKSPGQSGSSGECRSGVAEGGQCTDTCCDDTQCGGSQMCTLGTLSGHKVFKCGQAPGGGRQGDPASNCSQSQSSSCVSGACQRVTFYGFLNYDDCVTPCCGSSACGDLEGLPTTCWNQQVGADFVPLCSKTLNKAGTRTNGVTCTVDSECRSNRCYTDPDATKGKYCSDVCCVTSDCAPGMTCRPVKISAAGSQYFLRCAK